MKAKAITCYLIALSMLGSSVTYAQPVPQDRDRDTSSRQQPRQTQAPRKDGAQPGNSGPNQRADANRQQVQQPGRPSPGHSARQGQHQGRPQPAMAAVRPAIGFKQGERIPQQYRSYSYRVDNWKEHKLHQPPKGHQWVQIGGDFILIAAATGIITSILLNR